jgi:hypothetical protein
LVRSTDLGDEVEKNEMEVRHIAHMPQRRNAYSALVNNPERKMPLGDLRMGGINIKICCKGKGWEGMDWIHLAEDGDKWWAVVNVVMILMFL